MCTLGNWHNKIICFCWFDPQMLKEVVSTPGRPTGPDSTKNDGRSDSHLKGPTLLILFLD